MGKAEYTCHVRGMGPGHLPVKGNTYANKSSALAAQNHGYFNGEPRNEEHKMCTPHDIECPSVVRARSSVASRSGYYKRFEIGFLAKPGKGLSLAVLAKPIGRIRKKVYRFEPQVKKGSWGTLWNSDDAINRNEVLQLSSSRYTHKET
ncbi:hypothetical protein FH972_017892 [Carpinus fangiana]|uniref:Uncharacterized protein n=1 Tax=Carpinus fangiana TaxID=176857 RepID=A0A5N6RNU2_9ROSI|nr:hypothetical protein FH972_017892 [Carpinus fangiana]